MRRHLWDDLTGTAGHYRDRTYRRAGDWYDTGRRRTVGAYREGRRRTGAAVDALAGRRDPVRLGPLVVVGALALVAGAAVAAVVGYLRPRPSTMDPLLDPRPVDDRYITRTR